MRRMKAQFWTSRGLATAAILAIHGLVVAIALLARNVPTDAPNGAPMLVTLINEQRPETIAAPKIPLQQAQLPAPVIPVVSIDLSEEPTTAITVAKGPEVATAPEGDAIAPILATSVEYLRPPVVVYPIAAKRARATGTVHVRALVEIDGHVREARVQRSSGHELLDRAACDSVRGALFKPYMLNGAARTALVIVPIDFFLTIRTASR
jgi:periplasmic protein TonB